MIFTERQFMSVNKVMRKLNILRRWTGSMTDPRYDEISKQTINCMFAFFIAAEMENAEKNMDTEPVDFLRIVKTSIYRAYQKAYIFYDTPEHIYREICKEKNINYEYWIKKCTHDIIVLETDEGFAEWLEECLESDEKRLYEAATKVATYFELMENKEHLNGDFVKNLESILESMKKYESICGFNTVKERYQDVYHVCSRLRNQNRWAAYAYRIGCAVSGHLFDTAIYGFMNAINCGRSEKDSVKIFWIGIFHDVAEAFTRDIPSPLKKMIDSFRDASEVYELKKMKEEYYPLVPDYVAERIQDVMLENPENEAEFKDICKVADYLSAGSELYRQCPDEGFAEAMALQKAVFHDPNGLRNYISKPALDFFDSMADRVEQVFGLKHELPAELKHAMIEFMEDWLKKNCK